MTALLELTQRDTTYSVLEDGSIERRIRQPFSVARLSWLDLFKETQEAILAIADQKDPNLYVKIQRCVWRFAIIQLMNPPKGETIEGRRADSITSRFDVEQMPYR